MRITENDGLHAEWYKQARKEMTNEEIAQFHEEIINSYGHDYGTICHAVAASTLAHLNNLLYQNGMTGMQASFTTWKIIEDIFNVKIGAKLIKYDDMLYPQYEYKFNEKKLNKETFKLLQEKAENELETNESLHPKVRAHMLSIVEGKIPFGYELEG